MWPNPQETADLVTFTEEILDGNFFCVCVCVCAVCVMMVICKIATTDLKFTGKISQPSRKLSKNIFNSCHRSISSWLISSPRSRFSSSDRKSNFLENFPLPSISFYTCKTLQLIRSLRKPRCMPDLYITSLWHNVIHYIPIIWSFMLLKLLGTQILQKWTEKETIYEIKLNF